MDRENFRKYSILYLVNILYIKLVLKRKKSEPTEYIPVGRRQYRRKETRKETHPEFLVD